MGELRTALAARPKTPPVTDNLTGEQRLYHLAADPRERNNRLRQAPARAARLAGVLEE